MSPHATCLLRPSALLWPVADSYARKTRTVVMSETVAPTRSEDKDAPLLARIAQRDQQALAELYDRFSRPLLATVVRILNDPREAEDIVHDAFVTVWNKAGDYDASRGNAFSWVMTLTRNRALDRVRSRKRRGELLAQSAPADLGYEENQNDASLAADLSERASAVHSAFGELPKDQRQALELAYFSGLTQQEIATRLDQPLGTVKARIRRGLLKLRDLLAPNL